MFMFSGYPASVLRWRQGPVMSGFLTFMDRYRDEAACIAALAELRWPNGFICAGAPGGWLINWRLDRGFSNVPTAGGSIR